MPPAELDARGRRLRAAFALLVRADAPRAAARPRLAGLVVGIGLIIAGMMHQGLDVRLTAYAARDWRATFDPELLKG